MSSTAEAIRAKSQRAHRVATEHTIADIARVLQAELGQRLTAFIAGVEDPKAAGEWASGTRQPREDAEKRLRVAFQVFHILLAEESPHTVRNWFIGLNPELSDEAPAEAIREDRHKAVVIAARSYGSGG